MSSGAVAVGIGSASWRARVTVRLAPGVNDPQGNAVAESLHSMGHSDVRTTMIYTHVLNRGGRAVKSPVDRG